jgi:integrase
MKRKSPGDGTLRQRKDGVWEYRVSIGRDGQGRDLGRKSFYSRDKTGAGAKRKYHEWLRSADSGAAAGSGRGGATVGEWAREWLDKYKKDKVAYGTYRNYSMYVDNHIAPALGDMKLPEVQPVHIEEFLKGRADLSLSAQKHIHAALSGIFRAAAENGLIPASPVKPLKAARRQEQQIDVYSTEEVGAIVEAAKQHEHGALVLLLLYTGMRRGELIGLKWSDVDLASGVITIRRSMGKTEGGFGAKATKSGKNRRIGINGKLAALLEDMPRGSEYIISEGGHSVGESTFERRYNAVIGAAGVRRLSPHKCRHTFATHMIRGGADLQSVQALLGHSTVAVTEKYTHIDPDDTVRAVSALGY